MELDTIKLQKRKGVATVTLSRPEVLNAINERMFSELDRVLAEIEEDAQIRVAIFTGAGSRAFCAGADIHEMAQKAISEHTEPDDRGSDIMWRIAVCKKPIIGALNGLAYGGGALMASSFDIRVGCDRTQFRYLATSYGRVNSTWVLPLQIGWPMAKELLMTARVVDADEAYRMGLLNHLVSPGEVMEKANGLAALIAANDQRMVQGVKQLLIEGIGSHWEPMYMAEAEARQTWLAPTPVLDGFKDFLQRKGRAD